MGQRGVTALFTVDGAPYSKPRPRVTANGTYYPDHAGYERYQTDIQVALIQSLGYKPEPDEGEYFISATFLLKGKPRKDIDNLLGAVLDALNMVVWKDDKQVTLAKVEKRNGGATSQTIIAIQPRKA